MLRVGAGIRGTEMQLFAGRNRGSQTAPFIRLEEAAATRKSLYLLSTVRRGSNTGKYSFYLIRTGHHAR
jgi:hypothetical protein